MAVANVYSTISPRTQAWADTQLLKRAAAHQVLARFGQLRPIPKNKTNTVKFRRYEPFQRALAGLTEGTPPPSETLTATDIQTTLAQYGSIVEFSDVIADTHEDPILREIVDLLGLQAAQTLETLLWDTVVSGSGPQTIYAGGVTARNQVNSVFSLNEIRKAVKLLKSNKASMITEIANGSVNYGTDPVEPAYIAVAHTDIEPDLRNIPGFIPVAEYGGAKPILPQEVGKIEHTRFILSADLVMSAALLANSTSDGPAFVGEGASGGTGVQETTVGASNLADVYPIVIFGKDAFAHVPLKGKGSAKVSVLPPERGDKSDPLGQKGIAGWKIYFAAAILNSSWMVRIETAISAL